MSPLTALVDGLIYKEGEVLWLRFPCFNFKWKKYQLSETCTFFSGGTPQSSNKKYYEGNIPFIRSGEIDSDKTELYISDEGLKKSSAKMVNKGDLLIALYGATSGEIAESKINGAINQAIVCIHTTQNQKFLKYIWIRNVENVLKTYLQGGQGNLSIEIIKQLKFDFPCIKEQEKISVFLTLIDQFIDIQEHILSSYKKQKTFLLKQMFI